MSIGYPKDYPSACSLPFNRESLDSNFKISTPNQDPYEIGSWLLFQNHQLITVDVKNPELPFGECPFESLQGAPIYIGKWKGRPCRMAFLDDAEQLDQSYRLHSLHASSPQITLAILSLAGVGLMINHWEKSSLFCGYCGHKLVRLHNEWGKQCCSCKQHHFPRIHPCVIGLIVRGDELLLVRKPEWVTGRFGLVAGFVEFGESLEEAMVREVEEETGLQVGNLRYIGSQSWPFPSQIMNGFVADYTGGDLKLQEDELEEAAWYKLTELPALPPRRSIARYLIDRAAEFIVS